MAIAPLDQLDRRSPLAAARLRRALTLEEAARRAGLTEEQVRWLEDGRAYRFRSSDEALLAAVVYASSLEIDHREARKLAGLPVPPRLLDGSPRGRLIGMTALVVLLAALVAALVFPEIGLRSSKPRRPAAPARAPLPPPWRITVDVLNGSGDINYTRLVASRIGALAYSVEHVARADRFDYPQTAVYYEPGGAPIAARLARQLGVATKPLPGGHNPRRLVVIVGPAKGPG